MLRNLSRRRQLEIASVTLLLLWIAAGAIFGWVHTRWVQDEWAQFDSQAYPEAESFPEFLRFEYPKQWELSVYTGGNPANFGKWRRITLSYPYFSLGIGQSQINLHWRPVGDEWTAEDTCYWFLTQIKTEVNVPTGEACLEHFDVTLVGQGEYQAFSQRATDFDLGLFTSVDPKRALRIDVFLLVHRNAYAITFFTLDKTNGTLEAYQRFMDSLEMGDGSLSH